MHSTKMCLGTPKGLLSTVLDFLQSLHAISQSAFPTFLQVYKTVCDTAWGSARQKEEVKDCTGHVRAHPWTEATANKSV